MLKVRTLPPYPRDRFFAVHQETVPLQLLLLRHNLILGRFRHHEVPVIAFGGLGFHSYLRYLSKNVRNQIINILIG